MQPKAGDVIILNGEYPGCKLGDIGVIEGWVEVPQNEFLVCFHPSAFKGKSSFGTSLELSMTTGIVAKGDVVSVSGGPARYIKADELKPLPYTHTQTFWNWGGELPKAGGGVYYQEEVQAWEWKGKDSG